jgi:UDP-glucose 4-epimerase
MIEHVLEDYSNAYDFRYVALRYFNAAGAYKTAESVKSMILSVFGSDYNTPDGTCIRDYIHVIDLAKAHIAALNALLTEEVKTATYNLGNGLGYSVKEVIKTCEKVTGKTANVIIADRRAGDPDRLVARHKRFR